MANQYGIDYGNVLSKASDLKSAKLNQEAKQEQIQASKEERQNKLAEMSRQKQNVAKMASSDPRMAGYNIETTAELNQIQTFLKNADNKTKQEALQKVETLAKYSMAILNSQDPQQKKEMWEELKAKIPANAKGDMSDEYNEKWLIMKATEAKSIKDMIAEDVAKTKTAASQEKVKTEYENSVKLEAQKQKNKIAFEKAKSKTEKKETKTKLEKLFDLKAKLQNADPNDSRIEEVNKAIKLTTEGKPSEIEKLLAMQMVDPLATTTTKVEETPTKTEVTTEEDFTKKWGF